MSSDIPLAAFLTGGYDSSLIVAILTRMGRASMAVGQESRAPFLDHELVEFACRVPMDAKFHHGQGKWLLRQVLHDYVPAALVERPKMGFGVAIDQWLRGSLREWAEELLDSQKCSNNVGWMQPQCSACGGHIKKG